MACLLGGLLSSPDADMTPEAGNGPLMSNEAGNVLCPPMSIEAGNVLCPPTSNEVEPSPSISSSVSSSVPANYLCKCNVVVRNGVWCYACEQWYHYKCQGMRNMNSPEAEKWKSTHEEYICIGCKQHHLESNIHELESKIVSPPAAPPALPPCDDVVSVNVVEVVKINEVEKVDINNVEDATVLVEAPAPQPPLLPSLNKPKVSDKVETLAKNQIRECPGCDRRVTHGIMCPGSCSTWYHVKCAGFSKAEGKLIKSGERTWKCGRCKLKEPGVHDAINMIDDCTTWGEYSGAELVNVINNVYSEAVKWRINLFMLPSGEVGEGFIAEATKLILMFNSGSKYEPIALTMLMIMFPLLLQKPSAKSNVKTHIAYLEKRLAWWKDGKVQLLLDECRAVQDRLAKSKSPPQDNLKAFSRLMMQGRVSAALRFIGTQQTGLLPVTEEVLKDLKLKHPASVEPVLESLIKGPLPKVLSQEVIFENIDGLLIYNCSKKTSGAAGPSGADADVWKRILGSKQFKTKPAELCDAVAELARKLCVSEVPPTYLRAFVAGRLIPLDKKPGVRPIGVGEILRRVIGKAVTTVLKPELVNNTAPIQTCAGLPGGIEASIHAMRKIYDDPATEGVLLIDASNAFNALNRKAALNNIKFICPEFSGYVNNLYRGDAELFVAGSNDTVMSCEGTTQGGTESMGFYSGGLVPISHHQIEERIQDEAPKDSDLAKKLFYADDGAGGGTLNQILDWWNEIQTLGPNFGYFPKPSKTWLIVKPECLERARELFAGSDINITDQGHKYLGSYIGSDIGKAEFVKSQVDEWIKNVDALAKVAKTEPQLAYAAYVYGMSKKWSFVARTTPNISEQMKKLEYHVKETLIPAIVGKAFISDDTRRVFSLPARLGGLGFLDPGSVSDLEYESSVAATSQLTNAIYHQQSFLNIDEEAQDEIMKGVKHKKNEWYKELQNTIRNESSASVSKIIDLASEKGASCWLTSLPLQRYGFVLNKQQFHDSICLRYNYAIKLAAKVCACGEPYSVNHCLTCKKGGYVNLRHNSLRDLLAELLDEICKDVVIEPPLLPLTGEKLPPGSNLSDGARLDVSCINLWSPLSRAFIDVRVFNPQAQSNWSKSIPAMYVSHQNEKKTEYGPRARELEKATLTAAVMSTSGGMGKEMDQLVRRIATLLSVKRGERYSDTVGFVRRRIRFDLLRTCVIALRGYKKTAAPDSIRDLDFNLRPVAY